MLRRAVPLTAGIPGVIAMGSTATHWDARYPLDCPRGITMGSTAAHWNAQGYHGVQCIYPMVVPRELRGTAQLPAEMPKGITMGSTVAHWNAPMVL